MTEQERSDSGAGYVRAALGELIDHVNEFGQRADPERIAKLLEDTRIAETNRLTRQHMERFRDQTSRGVPAAEIDPFPPENDEIEHIRTELLKEGYTRDEMQLASVILTNERRVIEGDE